MSNRDSDTAVVIYENRPNYEIGVKLLVVSLEANFSEASIHVFAPNATADLQSWVSDHRVSLHRQVPTEATGWNVKPEVLLWAVDQGYKRAIWMDSDIIVSRSLPKVLLEQPDNVLVASELPGLRGFTTHDRTIPWGLEPGRSFPRDPSTCCSRVTQSHRAFLERWREMLRDPDYQRWQRCPGKERPIHAYGDDGPFIALLGAKKYEAIPVRLLRYGQDIAQCLTPRGYTVAQRVISLINGVTPIIHAMGVKPWLAKDSEQIYQSVSPYACIARRYQDALNETERDWLELPGSWIGWWYNLVRGHPALSGLPFAVRSQVKSIGIRSVIRKVRYRLSGG
jgi:hypothetical protein